MYIHFHRNIIEYRNFVITKGIINTEINNTVSNKDRGKKIMSRNKIQNINGQ